MDKIVKFVECLIPISQCNLKCSYCYVIQQNRRNTTTSPFRCTPEQIGEAFRPERWGGLMLVNLCAIGETLLCRELPDIVYYILKKGHYINITTNGTVSQRFDEILEKSRDYLPRLCFSFSLHYIELKKHSLLNTFVENVHKAKRAGCSILVQLNLADEYIDCLDEIKEFCLDRFGELPQIALTRRETNGMEIFTAHSDEEYKKHGDSFDSPLFTFTYNNFRVKRSEFCYAGKWTYVLDIASGELRSCYFVKPFYNIYNNIHEKIKTLTVGNNCGEIYCINSSHFMALGVIPDIKCMSYADLRDRNKRWYTQEMRSFLSQKLYHNNKPYNCAGKAMANGYFKFTLKRRKLIRRLSLYKRRLRRKLKL